MSIHSRDNWLWGAIVWLLILMGAVGGSIAITVHAYRNCDGVVVRNWWGGPTCVEPR